MLLDVRNKRNVGHLGADIEVNRMDSGFSFGHPYGYLSVRVMTCAFGHLDHSAICRWLALYPFGSLVESGMPL